MTDFAPTTQIAPESTVKPEDVIEVLRQCFDPEIPVNIVDLGLIYDIAGRHQDDAHRARVPDGR